MKSKVNGELMNTADVAKKLKVTPRRVLALIGRLRAFKVGRDWVFDPADVEAFALIERPTGNPNFKKSKK